MNRKAVLRALGIVLVCEAGFMLPSLFVAFHYREGESAAFLTTLFLLLSVGLPLTRIRVRIRELYARDGFAIVAFGWLSMAFFGALPFVFSGTIPGLVDALFESMSGFTTTGASILPVVEGLPRSILFWRSFTHWIGGMGVLMLTLAILPLFGAGSLHILRAESPGPSTGKLVPKIGQTAKILYGLYVGLTLAEIIALKIAGMSWFDALIHAFGTAGTGGFSNRNASVGAYGSLAINLIIGVFMFLFGMNFTLHYQITRRNWRFVLKDEELRFYVAMVAGATLFIAADLWVNSLFSPGPALEHAFFQVSSITTTTGFATADFHGWPVFSKVTLLVLMIVGPCAGSTGGGMKSIRVLMALKIIRRELVKMKHPQSVHTVRIGGRNVDDETLGGVTAFILFYLVLMVLAIFLVAMDSHDLETAFSSVVACLSNIGPGLSVVGPMGNYSGFHPLSKVVLSLCMVIGRLEIFPILLLAMPSFWRRVSI